MTRRSRVLLGLGRAVVAIGMLLALVLVTRVGVLVVRALPDDALDVAGPREAVRRDATGGAGAFVLADSLRGRSGALRFAALTTAEAMQLPGLLSTHGDTILERPIVLTVDSARGAFTLLLMRPFADKRGEYVGSYRLGRWPAERWMMASNYFNPDGFVEVHPDHVTLPLSTHFRLGSFLMNDQVDVWPKYVVIEEKLIDKLELVLAVLRDRGHPTDRVVVLSGFRAPNYNERQIDEGAARGSRHQFGDAADIIIDADGDGRMDDLNGDGRLDLRDARVIGDAVRSVEARYPELAGGLGTYAAMGPSGPFAHIDVRGTSARWETQRR